MMNLADLQKNWQTFGKTDPFWAILSHDDNKSGKWQVEEFFETGRKEIAAVLSYAASLPVSPGQARALDFGCGAGRLTQALAPHFEEVVGIDIAPSVIELADRYNQFGSKCRYLVNGTDNLAMLSSDSMDFIYSNIVLQHMQPQYSRQYIQEFCRVLAPGGLLIFQIPSEPAALLQHRHRIKRLIPPGLLRLIRSTQGKAVMEMYAIQRQDVIDLVEGHGGRVVDIQPDGSAPGWVGFRYCITKSERIPSQKSDETTKI